MGSDDESTQEIDVEALRDSLAAARSSEASAKRGTARSLDGTSVTAVTRVDARAAEIEAQRHEKPSSVDFTTPIGHFAPQASTEPSGVEAVHDHGIDLDALEDDDDEIEIVDESEFDEPAYGPLDEPTAVPAAALSGTLPTHDVARELRAMMTTNESPATREHADTAERPAGAAWESPSEPSLDFADTQAGLPAAGDDEHGTTSELESTRAGKTSELEVTPVLDMTPGTGVLAADDPALRSFALEEARVAPIAGADEPGDVPGDVPDTAVLDATSLGVAPPHEQAPTIDEMVAVGSPSQEKVRSAEPEELPADDSRTTRASIPAMAEASSRPEPETPVDVRASAPYEILDDELDELVIDDDSTSVAASAPPPVLPRASTSQAPPPAPAPEAFDPEEKELLDERRFGPLIAHYRQRLANTDDPARKAALLLKIAHVYETGLEDTNEAFQTLVEAFEIAPDHGDVVSEIDRLGKETGRIGELADKVKKKFVPGAPDDRRVMFLGHLVYWYERVLGRGSEISPFVSEIERHDKLHPLVLKRAAQLAAMNGNTKTQREHLTRALERTTRKDEKVALHLALASAHAGTADALKHYEAALHADPSSLVALQGVKRLGKEEEKYDQVQWALERQAEVAPTDAERIDALLELAELQETKFLKREAATELLERVLQLEPAHPAALKGLERCSHALRDWPKLARVLGIRAEATFDKKSKIELFELAAEVHESKLGDVASAVEVYRNLLVVEPKHRRALSDLARLYEKLGDWSNVATYKARIAELAPSKRASSQELVKLGDFLNVPERDPLAAKLQYEKAVLIDPTNAAGWEALQKIAAEAGDERRLIECLEQRKNHTEVPRHRAAVLVDLARAQQAQGDEDGARKSFEDAIRADSSNEAAAVAMLDAYSLEERWAEAAPLCELLVNAAIRDRDAESLFVRLRLATRIAHALGDPERAMTSAIAALDAHPNDPEAQADLIAVVSQCRESPAALARAREHLTRIAETPDGLAPDQLVPLAMLQRDLNDFDGAAATLERARQLAPEDEELTTQLAEAYLAQGDFPRACKLKVDMARNAPSIDFRFDVLCETGEIWWKRAEELEKAASVFEEARAIKPRDPGVLQTLMTLYGDLGDWNMLTGVLEEMAALPQTPGERIKSLISMAQIVREKLGDRLRAADLYDQVLDLDKKRLDIFEELVRIITEEKNWEYLEGAYRKMIERVKDDDAAQLQFLLFHQLGLIYRDRLGDAEQAYNALDAASRLQPDHAELRKIVTELLVVTDNLDSAVQRLRDDIDRNPHEPLLYEELYELFLRQHAFDKAWCAVNVLSRLREPTPEQRRFLDDYPPMPLGNVPGQIIEQAWRSHVFHEQLDQTLTNIFALMTPVVARMRFAQLRTDGRALRPFTSNHSRMHEVVRSTFDNASEILALAAPELLLGDLKSIAPFTPALDPFGATEVCGPAVEAQSGTLVYLVGRRLAEQRPELAARAFFPTVSDLTSLLDMVVRASRNEVAKDPTAATLDKTFAATLTPQEASLLRSAVLQAPADSTRFDVKQWLQAADLSSMRTGLLLAGDVEQARAAILAEGPYAELTAQARVGELYKFATSDLYSDLRIAIGVAVQA